MYKISFIIFTFITLSSANIFTITDKKGNVVASKSIIHTENECLNQKTTEYSQQALYDELHMTLQKQIKRNYLIMPNISKVENMFGVVHHPKVLTVRDMYSIFTKNIM
jgi:hypothetical protein